MINRLEPQPGQESVWDYPRPPRLEATSREIVIVFNRIEIARTSSAFRVLETFHPPVYYLPTNDIAMERLHTSSGGSFCEWKGNAVYYSVMAGNRRAESAGWSYPDPTPEFAAIRGYLAFYAGKMDACYVDGQPVEPQPGGFYGGWITPDLAGPFKGEPGTWGW